MKLYIKNMVCQGTRKFVLAEMRKLGLKIRSFETGEIEFIRELTSEEKEKVICSLMKFGLQVISSVEKPANILHTVPENAAFSIELAEIQYADHV